MSKKLSIIFLFLLTIPFALANVFDNVWRRIISFGNLSFLGFSDASIVAGFLRLLIGLLIFTVFFAVLTGAKQFKLFNRGQAGIVAAILAIVTAIFMPTGILLGIGAGYGTAISLLLIGLPVAAVFYALFTLPGEPCFWLFIKFVLLTILLWVLSAIKYHIGRII
ncbi:MAG: hypothetical protein CMH61_01325 [Nanoarchaeota archaeon]|nr:hypothetical protein [Nanoarchaeota archaeon]